MPGVKIQRPPRVTARPPAEPRTAKSTAAEPTWAPRGARASQAPARGDVSQQVAAFVGSPLSIAAGSTLSKASPEERRVLSAALVSLEAARLPPERRAAVVTALQGEWLTNGASVLQVARRVEIAANTGYVVVDRAPTAANPKDKTGWSDADVSRLRDMLLGLPANLKHREGLTYMVRDSRSEMDQSALDAVSGKVDAMKPGLGRSLLQGVLKLVSSTNLGASFGTAYFVSKEVRLYSELFTGSRLPGLHQMAAYTTIHEIGHHAVRGDPKLFARWNAFYEQTGRAEAPNPYAKSNLDEGFGVAIGMYAVAPELLAKRSPQTFAFMKKEYGDSLETYRGKGLEAAAIELVYGFDPRHQH